MIKPASTKKYLLWSGAYLLLLLIFCVRFIRHPEYNWDMLAYMGVILYYEGNNATTIHQVVYETAKQEIPGPYLDRMLDSTNTYRRKMFREPGAFYQQLPFYVVKPLYTRIAWILHRCGIGLVRATVLPSVMAWLGMGILLLYWLQQYWPVSYAAPASALLLLSPPALSVAALSSPDALCAGLLLLAFYLMTHARYLPSCIALMLAILARLDAVLPAMGCLLFLAKKSAWRWPAITAVAAGLLCVTFAVAARATPFGWTPLFYPQFARQLNSGYEMHQGISFAGYCSLITAQLKNAVLFTGLIPFLFSILFLARIKVKAGDNAEITLSLIMIAAITARFILQPLAADRLYVGYYLTVACFLVQRISLNHAEQESLRAITQKQR